MTERDARDVPHLHSTADQWHYLSEGHQSITFSLQADGAHPPTLSNNADQSLQQLLHSQRVALKLNKPLLLAQSHGTKTAEQCNNELQAHVTYSDTRLQPLLSALPSLYVREHVVYISGALCAALLTRCEQVRPSKRVTEYPLTSEALSALTTVPCIVTTDCTAATADSQTPTLCVELKPKWLSLTPLDRSPEEGAAEHINKRHNEVQARVCRFCMHQQYKVQRREIAQVSGYCPLDLISGDKQRVTQAVRSLFACPQNNLKVFLRRQASITDVDVTDEQQLQSAVTDCRLQRALPVVLIDQLCDPSSELYQALRLVQSVQHHFAPYSSHTIAALYRQQQQAAGTHFASASLNPHLSNQRKPWRVHMLDDFQIATTFKDLSIIINMCVDPATNTSQQNLSLVDLAYKPLTKIPRYLDLDTAIVEQYVRFEDDLRSPCMTQRCVERQPHHVTGSLRPLPRRSLDVEHCPRDPR